MPKQSARDDVSPKWIVMGGVAIVLLALLSMLTETITERDVYKRFASDVSLVKTCLDAGEADAGVVPTGTGDDDDRPLPSMHHRCEVHVLALLDSARDPAIQRERERVQHLVSAIRVALDAVRPDERRALDFVRELELLTNNR